MLTIAQVSQFERQGGAAAIAQQLFRAYRQAGHASWLITAHKTSTDDHVVPLLHDTPPYPIQQQMLDTADMLQKQRGGWRVGSALRNLAHPRRTLDRMAGHEDFAYPASHHFLAQLPQRPDILHLHNLHGGFFDLHALPQLSAQVPVMLTLHDTWMLAGHCGYFLTCDRWKTGCGACPDLSIYPALTRDNTAHNWQVKAEIYRNSRLYLATPCQWLMNQVDESMLRAGIVEQRVIYNGVDTSRFKPAADKHALREKYGIPTDASVILFAGNGVRKNRFKDYATMRATVAEVVKLLPDKPLWFVALGEAALDEVLSDKARVHFVPFQTDPQAVVEFYGLADIYLHAARADTFPNTVLEALSCGLPVVATGIGGIPEQVNGLALPDVTPTLNTSDRNSATGILAELGDSAGLAQGLVALLTDDALRTQLSANAVKHVHERFTLEQQTRAYLDWYAEIVAR